MINAVQAFLQRESVFVVHIFYQPTYLAWQKQVEVALIDLKHTTSLFLLAIRLEYLGALHYFQTSMKYLHYSFFFLMSINSSISSISHLRPWV